MKTFVTLTASIVTAFLFGGLFATVYAIPFVPLEQGVIPAASPTTGEPVATVVNSIIKWIIAIITVLAVVMLVVGGLQYMTSDVVSSKSDAKNHMLGAIYGLLIAVASYVILVTINPQLKIVGLESLNVLHTDLSAPGTPLNPGDAPPFASTDSSPLRAGSVAHESAVDALSASGACLVSTAAPGTCGENLSANRATCNEGCTSFEGLQQVTLARTIEFLNTCGCGKVTIIGGTENGHGGGTYSHANGWKIDVLSSGSDAVSDNIRKRARAAGSRSGDHGGPRYIDGNGNEYVYETKYNHWDITFNH